MRKFGVFAIIILLGVSCIFVLYNNNRPVRFNKERWTQSGGWEGCYFIGDDHFVRGRTRYRIALWLERNYSFTDKSLNDILEKFFVIPTPGDRCYRADSRNLERMKEERLLRITTRQRPDGWINPPINTNWLEFHFDENFIVSRVYNVHTDRRTERERGNETRRKIQ
jgi:hypothetical protein